LNLKSGVKGTESLAVPGRGFCATAFKHISWARRVKRPINPILFMPASNINHASNFVPFRTNLMFSN